MPTIRVTHDFRVYLPDAMKQSLSTIPCGMREEFGHAFCSSLGAQFNNPTWHPDTDSVGVKMCAMVSSTHPEVFRKQMRAMKAGVPTSMSTIIHINAFGVPSVKNIEAQAFARAKIAAQAAGPGRNLGAYLVTSTNSGDTTRS